MKKNIFLILAVCISSQQFYAQQNDSQAALYNIGTGAIIGGIGSIINKKKEDKLHKVLLKGLTQGALGGYAIFESKRIVRQYGNSGNYGQLWAAKAVHFAGASIIENAASNRNFWERWHINIGFARTELDLKRNKKFSVKIMPFALYGFVDAMFEADFSLKYTLRTGTPIFLANGRTLYEEGIGHLSGAAFANAIIVERTVPDFHNLLAHEYIHTFQYEGLSGINTFLNKSLDKWFANEKTYKSIVKKYVYLDLQAPAWSLLYGLFPYNTNPFEEEARYYGGF
ncbi:hypothetical protein [Flagellimonas onchidii]|uniref:hypothetical protein n=1 Tax=Flagellimonas onchidii TaxID=2562684 RepID=UPI0010A5F564|nr:hypothetical protein [Allomuricauda onchidii]